LKYLQQTVFRTYILRASFGKNISNTVFSSIFVFCVASTIIHYMLQFYKPAVPNTVDVKLY